VLLCLPERLDKPNGGSLLLQIVRSQRFCQLQLVWHLLLEFPLSLVKSPHVLLLKSYLDCSWPWTVMTGSGDLQWQGKR
jgi:hypothetical protein